jgi:hypothetical protein
MRSFLAMPLGQITGGKCASAAAAQGRVGHGSDRHNSAFATVLEALLESRLRKAEFEFEAYRRMCGPPVTHRW